MVRVRFEFGSPNSVVGKVFELCGLTDKEISLLEDCVSGKVT